MIQDSAGSEWLQEIIWNIMFSLKLLHFFGRVTVTRKRGLIVGF